MTAYVVSAVLIVILCASNVLVSYAVGRSGFYSTRQKTVQIALVWLVPFFGLLLVGGVFWSNYERPSSTGGPQELAVPDFAWPNDLPDAHH
jgi:hypothetical protein